MSDEYYQRAANFIDDAKIDLDDLNVNDVEIGLKNAGLKLVSIHSGKKLSEVPYEEIWIGMEVISANYGNGKIVNKIDCMPHESDNRLVIEWPETASSLHWHYWFNNVTVK